MTGATRQVAALLALRWRMLRSPAAQAVTVLAGLAALWLLRVVGTSGEVVEQAVLVTALEVAPGALLGFGLLALVAPLAAGGGSPVVPPDQLVALPVRASTHFLAGVLLAPVNLVWAVQLLGLAALTAYLTLAGSVVVGATTAGAYVAALTVLGQALAWWVAGAWRTRTGRAVVAAAAGTAVAAAVVLLQAGALGAVVEASPTRLVVRAVIAGGAGDLDQWWAPTAALLAATALAWWAGVRACDWALRRPDEVAAAPHRAAVRRRPPHRSPLRALVALDRASVWRAPALRRGVLVLLLLPGAAAAALRMPWESLVVLPGLVAAGAGLLFGINAFALDAAGALWLASLPVDPRLLLTSKALVLAEVVAGSVVSAALVAAVGTGAAPTAAQLTTLASTGVACAALVVALCLRASVRRPHRAELHGPRDAVAPPGALVAASARLAVPCTLVASAVAASAQLGRPELPAGLALSVVLASVLSLARTARRWDDPRVRARVVQAVARG